MNTKHHFQNIKEKYINSIKRDFTLEGVEGLEDLFQLEVLNGEQIFACNVCDQGFDKEDAIKKHVVEDHREIIIEISEDMENKESNAGSISSDTMDDEAWLAQFDDDGNFIG